MIKKCTCKHAYQDKRYGKHKRVHNPCYQKGNEQQRFRCTVCGDTK